jgi:basic membrane protein A
MGALTRSLCTWQPSRVGGGWPWGGVRPIRAAAVGLCFVWLACSPSAAAQTRTAPLRVGFVGELGADTPVQRMIVAGLRRAQRDLGVVARVRAPGPREGYFPSLAEFARARYDLVIAFGNLEAPWVSRAAQMYPRTRFAMIDVSHATLPRDLPNVEGVVFREQEVGYLAGYLSGLVERVGHGRRVVSSVGGFPIPPVDRFIAGFRAGARASDPKVVELNAYSSTFNDPAPCARVALSQFAAGSTLVFAVAGACGVGALAQARTHGAWGIGVDSDQSSLGPFILTSAIKRFDVAVFDSIRALTRHRFVTGGDRVYGLSNGGVALGRISPRVPRALVRAVDRVRGEIASGQIRDIPVALK